MSQPSDAAAVTSQSARPRTLFMLAVVVVVGLLLIGVLHRSRDREDLSAYVHDHHVVSPADDDVKGWRIDASADKTGSQATPSQHTAPDTAAQAASSPTSTAAAARPTASGAATASSSALGDIIRMFPSEGHWVRTPPDEFNDATLPLLLRYKECWKGMSHIKWERFRRYQAGCSDEKVHKVNRWRWESPQSLRRGEGSPALRDVVQRHLNGKTIAIVGDSLSAQHTASMVCGFVAELDNTTETSNTGPMVVNVTETIFEATNEMSQPVQFDVTWKSSPDSSRSHEPFKISIIYAFSPFTLDYYQGRRGESTYATTQIFWLDANRLEPIVESFFNRSDYFVFNIGHWLSWGVYPLSQPQFAAAYASKPDQYPDTHNRVENGILMKHYTTILHDVARVLQNRTNVLKSQGRKAPQIILRTTSHRHNFLQKPTSKGCTCGQFESPLNYQLDANGTYTELLDSDYYQFDKFLLGMDVHSMSVESAPALAHANLTGAWVVDGERTSRDRIEAHTDTYWVGCDCQHWCMPSVFEVWTDAMFRQIWDTEKHR